MKVVKQFSATDYTQVGSIGVALTIFKLRSWGFPACEMPEGFPFDVAAIYENKTIRIQVKSSQKPKSLTKYCFLTARGRYASALDRGAGPTKYSNDEVDLIALAALQHTKVVFKPAFECGASTFVPLRVLLEENCEEGSFMDGLNNIFNRECN